jgi:hypothetical protein
MDTQLARLIAKDGITEQLLTYARAVDRIDVPLIRSVFDDGDVPAFDALGVR